jgi:hypothetical protein
VCWDLEGVNLGCERRVGLLKLGNGVLCCGKVCFEILDMSSHGVCPPRLQQVQLAAASVLFNIKDAEPRCMRLSS